ncbi:MAG: hypothetical protein KJ732_00120, partial [Candidatus Margulisbacteria bacterium]|nr:hypothetical protein [Candidatus Margulisiibacteriota bacterium]
PDLIPTVSLERLTLEESWQDFAPDSGANLIAFRNGRNVIFLPFSEAEIVNQIPLQAPTCP